MTNNIDLAIKMLKDRGVEFGDPVDENSIITFFKINGLNLGKDFYNVYSRINGFISHDPRSQMMMWNMKDIEKNLKSGKIGGNYFIIGDFFIDSDYIVSEIVGKNANVKLLYENRHLSDSIENFIWDIALGKFDFM